jgi:uncharacterized protein DUF6188
VHASPGDGRRDRSDVVDGPHTASGTDVEIRFADAAVTRVALDYAAVLLLIGSADESLEIYIEGCFELHRGDSCLRLDPQLQDARLGELFSLRRRGFRACVAARDGTLRVEFDGDVRIVVAPDPDYDAWDVNHRGHMQVVALPGGELAIWDQ